MLLAAKFPKLSPARKTKEFAVINVGVDRGCHRAREDKADGIDRLPVFVSLHRDWGRAVPQPGWRISRSCGGHTTPNPFFQSAMVIKGNRTRSVAFIKKSWPCAEHCRRRSTASQCI